MGKQSKKKTKQKKAKGSNAPPAAQRPSQGTRQEGGGVAAASTETTTPNSDAVATTLARPTTRSRSRSAPPTVHSRSRRNGASSAPDDNYAAASSSVARPSAAGDLAEPSSAASQRSEEKTMIRNGIHPVTGLQVMDCVCSSPTECRDIMWRYAAIDQRDMFPYLRLPGHPAKPDTDTGKHVLQFRENVFHHLYGFGSNDIKRAMKGKGNKYIALRHFPPEIRECLRADKDESKKLNKFRVPLAVGVELGLEESDLTKVRDANRNPPGSAYLAAPIVQLKQSREDIAEAEREHKIRQAAKGSSSALSPPKAGRRTPKERELDALTREAATNPRAVALRLQDTEAELLALQKEMAAMKVQFANKDQAHKKAIEELNDSLVKELMLTGLNRRSLLSDEYHKKKGWLSKHFYGRPWKEHKARGRALFGDFVDNFDGTVTGEEPYITPFEKYSICCMVARRGFTQETVAPMYDRHRAQISRYMTEWMPLLGQAGADCSELDLEMSHNFFSVDFCKENGLPYVVEGIWHNLDESSDEE